MSYSTHLYFADDVRSVFKSPLTLYLPSTKIHQRARILLSVFERLYKAWVLIPLGEFDAANDQHSNVYFDVDRSNWGKWKSDVVDVNDPQLFHPAWFKSDSSTDPAAAVRAVQDRGIESYHDPSAISPVFQHYKVPPNPLINEENSDAIDFERVIWLLRSEDPDKWSTDSRFEVLAFLVELVNRTDQVRGLLLSFDSLVQDDFEGSAKREVEQRDANDFLDALSFGVRSSREPHSDTSPMVVAGGADDAREADEREFLAWSESFPPSSAAVAKKAKLDISIQSPASRVCCFCGFDKEKSSPIFGKTIVPDDGETGPPVIAESWVIAPPTSSKVPTSGGSENNAERSCHLSCLRVVWKSRINSIQTAQEREKKLADFALPPNEQDLRRISNPIEFAARYKKYEDNKHRDSSENIIHVLTWRG